VLPDDLAGMNEVANAVRFADGEQWVSSLDQFREYYEHLPNCDPATDIVVAEREGRLVGYGRTAWRDTAGEERRYEQTTFARPEEGAELLNSLMEAMELRSRDIAAAHPASPKAFYAESTDKATTRLQLLATRGYQPVRYFFSMVRPNVNELPDAPLPAGLEVREVQPDQLRAIFDAEYECMSDGWEYTVPTEEDFEYFVNDPVQGDYTLWRVAWDGDQVAGFVRGYINELENETYRRKRGWVENINTRRPWRRRGLARALIGQTISALRERGMTEAALGVDSENPSGALHLYESCGFAAVSREATYRKPLVER
jgi:ribosomal protein S18 acetylase RimI-like enzyme